MLPAAFLPLLAAQAAPLPECDRAKADMGVQIEMNICAQRAYLLADRKLNAQWKATAAKMKARDGLRTGQAEDERAGYFAQLLAAQRAWLAYRDAHCASEGYYARGGSLEPLLVSTCKTRLTETRTAQLRELAEWPQ